VREEDHSFWHNDLRALNERGRPETLCYPSEERDSSEMSTKKSQGAMARDLPSWRTRSPQCPVDCKMSLKMGWKRHPSLEYIVYSCYKCLRILFTFFKQLFAQYRTGILAPTVTTLSYKTVGFAVLNPWDWKQDTTRRKLWPICYKYVMANWNCFSRDENLCINCT
jgi:hypothetical protein